MKTEDTLTPNESLDIINQMVEQARFNFSKNSAFFIIWAVLLIGAALYQFVAQQTQFTQLFWIGWPIAGLVGGIISSIYGNRIEKQQGHRTHLDRMYSSIWMIYLVTLVMMLVALVYNHLEPSGYIMLLTGLPTVLTGRLLKFTPLVYGGISLWIFGLITLFVLPQFGALLFIASMITGYLIPGLMMRNVKNA